MIRKVTTYEGTIDPELDIEVEFKQGTVEKAVDDKGQPVATDVKGVPLVDTHQTKSFPQTKRIERLRFEGGETIENSEDVPAAGLTAKASPKELRAAAAAKFAAKLGVAVK